MFLIGAAEKTRTSTGVTPQRPQRCASTSSATAAQGQVGYNKWRAAIQVINAKTHNILKTCCGHG